MINPATSKPIGELGHVSRDDLDEALAAVDKGFKTWRKVSSFERGKVLRKAADLVRAPAEEIAKVLTQSRARFSPKPRQRCSPPPTSSTGTPPRANAPTAASFRPAPTACATW